MTRAVLLRGVGLVVACSLGAVSVWLIVMSTTQKSLQLGVIAGLWAALIGAFAMFGPRRATEPPSEVESPGAAIELRSTETELERAEEAAARRAHEARLEHMLRREVQRAISSEVATLRAEIAGLRAELLEKVGGQLRLERIETTRVIGSDLEALQHEVRQLKAAAREQFEPLEAMHHVVESGPVPSETTGPIRAVSPPPAPPPYQPAEPAPYQPAEPPRYQPANPPPPPPREAVVLPLADVEAVSPSAPAPEPDLGSLPRLAPFTDFELDPVDDEPAYTGRRRRRDDTDADAAEEEPRGRRHRRATDGDDDLLARLLARESAR